MATDLPTITETSAHSEAHFQVDDLVQAAGNSNPNHADGDKGKRLVVVMTSIVLAYPLLFATFYPLVASALKLDEQASFPIGSLVLEGRANIAFALSGTAILLANLIAAFIVQRRLQNVHEDVRAAVAKIRGFAAAGGAAANKAIDEALANFTHLLSWRYLFTYVGPVTLVLYIVFVAGWTFAAVGGFESLLPGQYFQPTTRLAVWVLAYYVLAFVVRDALRRTTSKYLG